MKAEKFKQAGDNAKALRKSLAHSYLAAQTIQQAMRALRQQVDQANQAGRQLPQSTKPVRQRVS